MATEEVEAMRSLHRSAADVVMQGGHLAIAALRSNAEDYATCAALLKSTCTQTSNQATAVAAIFIRV